jgi:hypothetical protein
MSWKVGLRLDHRKELEIGKCLRAKMLVSWWNDISRLLAYHCSVAQWNMDGSAIFVEMC